MKTDPYQTHHVNETLLIKLVEKYDHVRQDELVPHDEVKDVFESVFYSGRDFEMTSGSALALIATKDVLDGETAKAGDIVSKLMEIKEDL